MSYEENLLENELMIGSEAAGNLKESALWGRFLGVLGFIYSAIIVLSGIYAGMMIANLTSRYSGGRTRWLEGSITAFLYVAAGAIVFFMSLYLFRFARKAGNALASINQEDLNASLKNLKIYFRFAGVMSIIMLILTIMALIGVLLAASYSRY